jgi:hypothetical protein
MEELGSNDASFRGTTEIPHNVGGNAYTEDHPGFGSLRRKMNMSLRVKESRLCLSIIL